MKKILLTLVPILLVLFVNAQDSKVYKINRSEMYIYNSSTKEWDEEFIHDDVSISLVAFKNVINIQAKTPSLYRLNENSKEKVETNSLVGFRYRAIECVDMKDCIVDILVSKNQDNKVFVFSVRFDNETLGKINFRYLGYVE